LASKEATVVATEAIVDLDEVVMQAWQEQGLPATRRQVEAELVAARRRRLEQYRREGRQAYAWGYVRRKSLLTPVGELGPLRLPRLRCAGREVRLIPKQMRRLRRLDELVTTATVGGLSQRRVGVWLRQAQGQSLSAATVGTTVARLGEAVERQRYRSLLAGEYVALAVDGIWGRYRRAGEAVLLTAVGVRRDGRFDVVDWEPGPSESAAVAERLLTRLYQRGLTELGLLVADGAGAIRAAQAVVYPGSAFQLCLWHWGRTLKAHVATGAQREFSRDYWEVYNGLDRREVAARALGFCRRWRQRAPQAVRQFRERWPETLGFLRFPAAWRHRVRTVNLAEGFFRNFRRFFNRFPGFQDEAQLARVMGLYLLAARPERWRPRRQELVA
jgi:transposase-like protein